MNGHKSDFRLHADDKLKKDNKTGNILLYDHLFYIDHFQVCIVDLIHVDNNNEHQLGISEKAHKWICAGSFMQLIRILKSVTLFLLVKKLFSLFNLHLK